METLFGNVSHLLRRRWYIVVAVVLLGALAAGLLSHTEVASRETLRVTSVADQALALGLKDYPEVPAESAALQAQADLNRSPENGNTGTIVWDPTARSITISLTGDSVETMEATANRLSTELTERLQQLVEDQIDVAVVDAEAQMQVLDDAAAAAETTASELLPSDPTGSVLLATASDLRSESAKASARRSSLASMKSIVPSLVESTGAAIDTSEPGFTTYLTGALVAGALSVLGACGWVLADRRVRRRLHLERAAPGVRDLGLVGSLAPGRIHIDLAVVASVKSFARDSDVTALVLFGVPSDDSMVSALADALQANVDFRVAASGEPAANSIHDGSAEAVGYVAVVRWGKTTESQLSAAVADIRSVGGLPLAVILVGVPKRERTWAGASLIDVIPPTETV